MTDTPIDVEEFRDGRAPGSRRNLEPRDRRDRRPIRGTAPTHDAEDIAGAARAAAQAVRRRLRRHLATRRSTAARASPPAHERAFREEAAGYVMPDLGVAGGVTFGPMRPDAAGPRVAGVPRAAHPEDPLAARRSWCQFYSEPEAGSDLAGIRTRGRPRRRPLDPQRLEDLEHRRLLRRLGDVPGPHRLGRARSTAASRGSPCRPTRPGVTISAIRQINGNAEFCEEFLDDVVVTDDDVIGEVNRGWTVTQTMLVYERGGGTAAATAGAPRSAGCGATSSTWSAAGRRRRRPASGSRSPGAIHVNDLARGALRPAAGGADGGRSEARDAWRRTASWPSGVLDPIRAELAMQIGGEAAIAWATASPARPRRSTTSTAGSSPSPAAPTRCSATGSASGCSGCRASRRSTPTSRSARS